MVNRKLKRFIVICVAFLLTGAQNLFGQQLPLFSEYMFNTLEINPAYAGFRDAVNITTMFRKQWTGFKTAPQSAFLSADMPIANKRVGVGIKLIDDRDEITKTLGAQGVYSFTQRSHSDFRAGFIILKLIIPRLMLLIKMTHHSVRI
jgi:type IX secretion system PorP/SprF family membrane protein